MALEAKIRPTSLILHTQPHKKWTKYDFLLVEAYSIFRQERCTDCGMPIWVCHNEDSDIRIDIEQDTCFVIREVESVRNTGETVDEKTRKSWGVSARPKIGTYSGRPLDIAVRDAYYEAEYKRRNPEADAA